MQLSELRNVTNHGHQTGGARSRKPPGSFRRKQTLIPLSGNDWVWVGSCRCRSTAKQAALILSPAVSMSQETISVASTGSGAPTAGCLPTIKL